MNFLEKKLIKKLLEPKNTEVNGNEIKITLGALKSLPAHLEPLLPLAEKCLSALPGIEDVRADTTEGNLRIRYDAARLSKDDVIKWYSTVLGETIEVAGKKEPQDITEADMRAIANAAMEKLN